MAAQRWRLDGQVALISGASAGTRNTMFPTVSGNGPPPMSSSSIELRSRPLSVSALSSWLKAELEIEMPMP